MKPLSVIKGVQEIACRAMVLYTQTYRSFRDEDTCKCYAGRQGKCELSGFTEPLVSKAT